MLTSMIVAFLVPIVLSLVITPWVIRLAHHVGAMDRPDERKTHTAPVPRIGGLAVFFSFFLSLCLILVVEPQMLSHWWIGGTKGLILFATLMAVVALGIWDDLLTLGPARKFGVQLLLSTVVYLAGFRISNLTDPFGFGPLDLGVFDYVVTVLWIVGVTNALNLIDGLDGLASGVAAIAALTVFCIALLRGDPGTAMIALLLSGSVLGFLRYNFNPAKIFLGDSGSLFLGFTLAVLSIQSSTKGPTAFAMVVPILALGLPIMDTLLSMARRFMRWFLPHQRNGESAPRMFKSMFVPDRAHVHHRLLARGLSQKEAVILLYIVSCILGAGALTITFARNTGAGLILGAIGVATVLGVRQLRYKEIRILSNGALLPVFDLRIINYDLFIVALDVVFMIVAASASYLLAGGPGSAATLMKRDLVTILLTCTVQFGVFAAIDVYKATLRQFGFVDALKMVKSVFLAVLVNTVVLTLMPVGTVTVDVTIVILDFYFLASMVVASRVSFRILRTLFHQESHSGRRVLIYGANDDGVHALRRLYEGGFPDLTPAGFLDDNPALEGKELNGLPVYGGHWKLARLVQTRGIQELLLSSDNIRPEVLRRLRESARALGISLKRLDVRLEDISPETSRTHAKLKPFMMGGTNDVEVETYRGAKAS